MSIRANVGRPREHNAEQGPEKPNIIREALALVDAAYQPVAAEHAVIDAVLVDAVAKAGLKQCAGWTMAIMEGERLSSAFFPSRRMPAERDRALASASGKIHVRPHLMRFRHRN